MHEKIAAVDVCALLLGQWMQVPAQKKFPLTIENIMRGPGLYGYEPATVRWSGDSQKIYFQWKQASDPVDHPMDTYVVNRDGSDLRKLSDDESKFAPPEFGSETRDRKRMVYALDGDLFLFDFSTGTRRQLTKTVENESNPQFTHDEKHVAFQRGGNLYVMSLDTGMLEQMTEIGRRAQLRRLPRRAAVVEEGGEAWRRRRPLLRKKAPISGVFEKTRNAS